MESRLTTELSRRVATGIAGGAAILLLVAFGGWLGVFVLAAALILGMAWEYGQIGFRLSDQAEKKYLLVGLVWISLLANLFLPRLELEVFSFLFLLLFTYFLFTAPRHAETSAGSSSEAPISPTLKTHFQELATAVFGVFYIGYLPAMMLKIHDSRAGKHWLILFFLIVWLGDTGAYFSGKRWGSAKLFPLISPKKTWAGAWGGLISGILIAVIYKFLLFHDVRVLTVILIACVVGGVSQIGDLCESFFKRAFQVKDSGGILPGHGGFLDRFDGMVFSLPAMYLCMKVLG